MAGAQIQKEQEATQARHFQSHPPVGPGWASPEGKWDDARLVGRDKRMFGLLPREWAHYEGLYLHGGKKDGAFIADTFRPPMAGRGFIAVPIVALDEAVKRYGFQMIGHAKGCRMRFHAITAERRIAHPSVALITNQAQAMLKCCS